MKNTAYWMEFMMTYGYAIIIVLVLGGSLVYFGKLSPDNLLPLKSKIDKACEIKCAEDGLYYQKYTPIEDNRFNCHCTELFILNITIKQ